jgi:hypothetical protein
MFDEYGESLKNTALAANQVILYARQAKAELEISSASGATAAQVVAEAPENPPIPAPELPPRISAPSCVLASFLLPLRLSLLARRPGRTP